MFSLNGFYLVATAAICFLAAAPTMAAPVVGETAPDFEATDVHGKPFKLSDHKGKIVVLEWTNRDCPFVVKHYDSGNMQALQKKARADGAEWISIMSSAPGREGNITEAEVIKNLADTKAEPTTVIRDEAGTIGKSYDAQTTPHMFVIDAEGKLAYAGAIDSNSSPRASTIEGATNYVVAALDDLKAGRAVATPQTPPYGCSVKYAE